MRRKNDILWKGLIEEIFDDLLRFIFPEADRIFDMQRGFDYLDKELGEIYPEPGKDADTRFVDKLVKAYRRDGQEEWVLCHVEIQGETKKKNQLLFAERMFRYYYRIFDRYQKPMTALAIFTNQDGWKMPDRYEYHFLGTSHIYQYNTYCIMDPSDEELANSENPFAVVVLAARKALLKGKIADKELLEQKLLVARMLLGKKQFSRQKVKAILSFLYNYIVFKDPEINLTFIEQIDKITSKTNSMGYFEYLAEIRSEEAREQTRKEDREIFVKNLLSNTDFSNNKIASLADVSVYFVKKTKKNLAVT